MVTVLLSVLVCILGSLVARPYLPARKSGTTRNTFKGGAAWGRAYIVSNGKRHEVALAPSGDCWMRFDRLLLAAHAGAEVPAWIGESEKKGAFIGSYTGRELTLRGWAGRLLGNEGVMLLHAPKVTAGTGDEPVELELDPGKTADPRAAAEFDAVLDRVAAEQEGARYRALGSTVKGGRAKDALVTNGEAGDDVSF